MSYLSCISLSLFLCLFCAGLPVFAGSPARAADQPPASREVEFLELYFDEEDLVEVATRYPKPISQVAGNVTIVTAEEIEAMNAHTVAEVLRRVPGVFVSATQDFGGRSTISIHGSDVENVLVLLDGIRLGYLSEDLVQTGTVPLRIIKRIEVIKGAASSTWGSALGGVVNIITRDVGTTAAPTGMVAGSFGEAGSREYGAETAGKIGRHGYYLYAGKQKSDGLLNERYHDSKSFYSKINLDLQNDLQTTFTLGYKNLLTKSLHDIDFWYPVNWDEIVDDRVFFYTGSLDVPLTSALNLNLSLYSYENGLKTYWPATLTGIIIDDSDTTEDNGRKTGGGLRLAWDRGPHTVVLGAETVRRENSRLVGSTQSRDYLEENWAVYINDTYRLGRATFIPGLRYDHLSISDGLISPSLGFTFRLSDETLLRAAVARGFRKPTVFLKNDFPLIDLETTRTYQAGIETVAARFFRLKSTLFIHNTDDAWDPDNGYASGGAFRRSGVEIELETMPWRRLSLTANGTYVRQHPKDSDNASLYNANLIFRYDDKQNLQAQLMGHYVWWGNIESPDAFNGQFGNFIWDATLTRKLMTGQRLEVELFFSGHNLFSGEEYNDSFFPNPQRWFEGGVRLQF